MANVVITTDSERIYIDFNDQSDTAGLVSGDWHKSACHISMNIGNSDIFFFVDDLQQWRFSYNGSTDSMQIDTVDGATPSSNTNLETLLNTALTITGGGSLPDQTGNSGKYLTTNGTDASWATITGGGDLLSTNNLSDLSNPSIARTNLGLNTTANQTDSTDKRFMSDAQESKLDAISGSNTGDETTATIKTKLGTASGSTDGYLTSTDWTTFNNKQDALTNGYGLSGTTTKAVGLSYASAFATATTSISAATYADITGCSVSLAAGTWLVMAHVVGAAANAIVQCFGAITHSDNTVIAESAISRPASGTASLNSPISMTWQCIVTPASTTTYKLRAARGLTTHTGTWTVYDGSGYNTTNHATNNSDKGTSIIAIRIA